VLEPDREMVLAAVAHPSRCSGHLGAQVKFPTTHSFSPRCRPPPSRPPLRVFRPPHPRTPLCFGRGQTRFRSDSSGVDSHAHTHGRTLTLRQGYFCTLDPLGWDPRQMDIPFTVFGSRYSCIAVTAVVPHLPRRGRFEAVAACNASKLGPVRRASSLGTRERTL